jgi:hypothetical protein
MHGQPIQGVEPVTLNVLERVLPRLPQGLQALPAEASPQLPPLAIGQMVTATIIEQLPTGQYRLALAGVSVEASAPAGLLPGSELSLQVVQLTPEVTLHLLPPRQGVESEVIRLLRTLLPQTDPVSESLSRLRQELSRTIAARPEEEVPRHLATLQDFLTHLLPEDAPPRAERLHAFVRDGGLQYETKLLQLLAAPDRSPSPVVSSDLKGLLLQSMRQMESSAAEPDAAALKAVIQHHLDHVETQQALNLLAQAHAEPHQLQIPMFLSHALSTAFLSIDPDAQHKKGETGDHSSSYHLLFMLNLEDFGQTRIDAFVNPQTLRVSFYAEESAALTQLRTALPALEERLRTLGGREVIIEARPLALLSPEQRRQCDALGPVLPRGVNLVDLQV